MNYNERILNRDLDNYLMKDYMEEYPASEPVATTFQDAESQISSYVQDHITDHDELPDMDEVFHRFHLISDADWEALEKCYERERRLTKWDTKTPSLK